MVYLKANKVFGQIGKKYIPPSWFEYLTKCGSVSLRVLISAARSTKNTLDTVFPPMCMCQSYRHWVWYQDTCSFLFLASSFCLLRFRKSLPRVVSPDVNKQGTCASLHDVHHSVIHGVLVFLKPPSDIVADSSSIVDLQSSMLWTKLWSRTYHSKVSIGVSFGHRLGKSGTLAKQRWLQLLF